MARNRFRLRRLRWIVGLLLTAALVGGYFAARETGALNELIDGQGLESAISELGILGPFLVVALMTFAIVMSPVPSAPIALASGAVYGHFWGALYVAFGAEAGALIAFGLARFVGLETVKQWLGTQPSSGFLNRFLQSQNALTVAVFATRLMPFLSFDLVSYAAGLTPLKTWRFAVATLLGIIPASFVLAHFGQSLVAGSSRSFGMTVLVLGTATLVPVVWKMMPSGIRVTARRIFRFR